MHMHCVQANAIGGFASTVSKSLPSPSPSTTMAMPSPNSLRVAAAQMTSVSDLAANFATCSRLVKVLFFFIFSFLGSLYFLSYSPILFYIILFLFFFFLIIDCLVVLSIGFGVQRKQLQLEPNCFAFLRPSLMWVSRMGTVLGLLSHWMDQL